MIAIDHQDMGARRLKAAAFRKLGYATYNSNRRGFYLMGALELEGKLDPKGLTARYMNPDNIKKMPVPLMLESIRYRVDPKRSGAAAERVALVLPGETDAWIVELRNSTLKSGKGNPGALPTAMLDRAALGELVAGSAKVDELVRRGTIRGDGAEALGRIFAALDLTASPINLVVR